MGKLRKQISDSIESIDLVSGLGVISHGKSMESVDLKDSGTDLNVTYRPLDTAFRESDANLSLHALAKRQEAKEKSERGCGFLRRKWTVTEILTTCALYFEVFGWGLFHGVLGPTLLDLEQLTGTTTAQISLMFTALTVGALVGAPVGGVFLDKFNCRLVLAFILLGMGVMASVIPLASNFTELLVISVILGVFAGALDCGQNVTALLIWGWDGAVLMQGFHCVFALGTFVAPWIAKPFISTMETMQENNTYMETTTSKSQLVVSGNDTKFLLKGESSTHNTQSMFNSLNPTGPSIQDTTSTPKRMSIFQVNISENSNNTDTEQLSESQVHFTYLIVGAYIFISSLCFVIVYFIHRRSTRNDPTKQGKNKNSGITTEKNSRMKSPEPAWYRWPMLVLMFFRFAIYVGLDIMTASFLMTFAVKGLGWDKDTGVALTSCFRGVYSIGRGSSILFAVFISPSKMIIMNLVLINIGLGVLAAFFEYHPLILWIFISLAGFGMGSFYGASMSWIDKYLNVTGKTGSLFILGSWVGLLTLPALTGYLFDNISPFCYIYSCLGTSLVLLIVTVSSMLLAHCYHSNLRKQHSNQGQEMETFRSNHNHDESLFPESQEDNQSKQSFHIVS